MSLSFDEFLRTYQVEGLVDRPALYIGYPCYEGMIRSILTSVVLNPAIYTVPSLIELDIMGPLQFRVRADGAGLTARFLELAHFKDCSDNLLWELSDGYDEGFGHRGVGVRNCLGLMLCLLGWSRQVELQLSTAHTTVQQTYRDAHPTGPAVWRERGEDDPAFRFIVHMTSGHFADEAMRVDRVAEIVPPDSVERGLGVWYFEDVPKPATPRFQLTVGPLS